MTSTRIFHYRKRIFEKSFSKVGKVSIYGINYPSFSNYICTKYLSSYIFTVEIAIKDIEIKIIGQISKTLQDTFEFNTRCLNA